MMTARTPFAHTHPDHPEAFEQWERLLGEGGHLEAVAQCAEAFAAQAFSEGAAFWPVLAALMGRWHDLGKFSDDFQGYLRASATSGGDSHTGEVRGKVDHTSAGAQHAMTALPPPLSALLAYPIAGHHAGLLDGLATGACLKARLTKSVPDWRYSAPDELLEAPAIELPKIPGATREAIAFNLAFATRMLFSCLVDADFLATEAFMNPQQAAQRPTDQVDFTALDRHLSDYMQQRFGDASGRVAEARAEVLAACLKAAEGQPGLYSLTVPTGGGKTLASLAFALRHAACNGLGRVIYAIPFTSIIEQNAETFREVFEAFDADLDELILEHHSNFDPDNETTRLRLASENWDAPLVVTTNVQLFESLFANRTSRCRKLHRIAGSVIILDEVQTLPVTLLEPCLKVLRLLVEQYGCSVVLCTATQPAIEYREKEFEIGLPEAIPIIADAPALYRRLKRVEVRDAGTLDCSQLADRLLESEQALAIVNTRRHAADLYRALKEKAGAESCFHLSAAMIPNHRSTRLDTIRQRLKAGQRCRVVATQLIEAGVDVDFPVVWRSLAGLDSIAQAAGRCNREGLRQGAITWAFRPDESEHPIPRGYLRRCADAASQVMATGRYHDLLGLDTIAHYFRLHYWQQQSDWDKQGICDPVNWNLGNQPPYLNFNFATVAERFRFIGDSQRPIIVPHDDKAQALVERLYAIEASGNRIPRELRRKLQRYSVSVAERHWRTALGAGQIELLCEWFAILAAPQLYYHPELGLQLDADPLYDPNELVIG
ncbi:CRISPR-associated helicase, Cas3 family [endosymbiont of Ridgeia piscesae]|jgi:CRISPR-associated endonuclease/helicase Cas3|uniref:CRISPR-associated helicase, Cas3 family n=3 Tax=endosymbiont of Ridgeia piscesae TaxID=54398 RepID=A0A0T5YW12_9GAMM|nr:CRISPR-associated helicase/endonuclease Cas3 [endosymbiont of Ridgeia piscesae]KRT54703.1 CRISPR-associated helicase, Cas3 family [endosymbiont of Ridgeia piscesae]